MITPDAQIDRNHPRLFHWLMCNQETFDRAANGEKVDLDEYSPLDDLTDVAEELGVTLKELVKTLEQEVGIAPFYNFRSHMGPDCRWVLQLQPTVS